MVNRQQLALNDASEWLGDWHPLAEQLGSAASVLTLSSITRFLKLPEIVDVPSLREFLRNYEEQVLERFELPAIYASQQHAEKNEVRELIELDRTLADERLLELFAEASRRIGRWQIQKLRPLKDQRIVQRYLAAVERGDAIGWHTVVYGLTLAIYSLPSRQGLFGYAHQVIRGQIHLAARDLKLSERDCRELFDECCSRFPAIIDRVVRTEPVRLADVPVS